MYYHQPNILVDYEWENESETKLRVTREKYPQQLAEVVKAKMSFGHKSFFICPKCAERKTKLYFVEIHSNLMCKQCSKLSYYVSSLSKSSAAGKHLHKANRMLKIIDQREKMRGVYYNGKFTRRFNAWLKQCVRNKYLEPVNDALKLEKMLSGTDFQKN